MVLAELGRAEEALPHLQKAVKQEGSATYAAKNLEHFRRKWGRTVRGNSLQRRWSDVKGAVIERYERIRYGHVLVERG